MQSDSEASSAFSPVFVHSKSRNHSTKLMESEDFPSPGLSEQDEEGKESNSDYQTKGKMVSAQLQVIDESQNFSDELTTYMNDVWGLGNTGFNYNLVAVFGSQSTGKSTLLNALFNTGFDTMGETCRKQTTKGLWVSLAKSSNTLVMDVEGVDGRERGEDQDFERKSALFSLAVSQVVIINIWENQIGLYNGANMGLLKTVFEVNLELFQQKGKGKTLLFFVIRDHIGKVPLAQLSETLKQDLQKSWNELSKPKGLEGCNITDFFDFMFFGLPHKILLPEEFDEQVQILKQCFYDSAHPNYVFRPQYHKRIPADGFKRYAESIWEQIITNKNLDLPTQQQLLAQFRCDEIATSVFGQLLKEFSPHREAIDNGIIVDDLGNIFNSLKSTALAGFDNNAGRYNKEVYDKKRADLEAKIHDYFHTYFKLQLGELVQESYESFAKSVDQGLKATDYDFTKLTSNAASKAKEDFNKLAQAILIEGSLWAFTKEQHLLNNEINDLIATKRQGELSKLERSLVDNISNHLEDNLPPLFNDAKADLWPSTLVYFFEATDSASKDLHARAGVFEYTKQEVEERVANLRVKGWESYVKYVKDEVADTMLLAKLRYRLEESFRYDADGLPRVWKPEDDIDGYFRTARNSALELLPLLSKIDITSQSEIFDTYFDYASPQFDFKRSLIVVSSAKHSEIETRFKREADALFIEAKRSVVSTTAKVPYWILVLLLVLGWNEILYVITSPFTFLMLVFGGAAFYAVWTLNLVGPITRVVEVLYRELGGQIRKALEESLNNNQADIAIPLQTFNTTQSTGSFGKEKDSNDPFPLPKENSTNSSANPPAIKDLRNSLSVRRNKSQAMSVGALTDSEMEMLPGSVNFDD